ncbi:hypothetical protein C7M84_023526 [Penaeus vannamei]|uniref:NACHT domain-containing protein n=1 Tax=Penaeus vannamei TaxID=6689 RepID=A0A423U3L0_PENVA|nr:hypothetical protein C7M84_023526 [Penaeus vannamei]
MASSIPAPATFARLHHTIKYIQRILAEVHKNFSLLDGRSLDDFFEQEKSKQSWAKRMFVDHKDLIESATPPEEFDCHLLYKMIKYMDGLAKYNDPAWESNAMDSIESLVYFVFREWDELKEGFVLSEQSLSRRLDGVQDALVRIVSKIEGRKGIDLKHLKVEVHKEFNSSLSTSFPYIYKVSSQHSIHRMLVLLYKQLNRLNGKSVEAYRKETFEIRSPLFAFTPAEKMMLRKNICPEKMPIRLVFKLLERVCGLERQKSPAWSEKSDRMEYLLTRIIKNHQEIVYSAQNLDYDWPYELFQLFEKALEVTMKITGRTNQEIMKEMPDEPVHLNEAYSCSVLCKTLTSCDSFGTISDPEPSSLAATPPASLPSLESLSIDEINIACLFQAVCSKGPAVRTLVTVFQSFKGDIAKVKSGNKKKLGLTHDDEVKMLREQLCYDLLQECRKELSEKYNQASAKLASPVTWSLHPAHKKLTIDKVFTEPEIDYSRKSMKRVQKNDIMVLMQNLKAMFIVDSYDEATYQAKELISDILHTLPRSTIIITTKQHAVSYIEMKVFEATGSDCMLLKVQGFGEDKQKEYVRNFFQLTLTSATSASEKAEADKMCTEMETYLDSLDKCHREFVSLPLTLSLLVILWQDNSKSAKEATTLTRLYQKIIRYTLKRFAPEDSDVRRWILALGKIAWQSLNRSSQCLTNKDEEKLMDLGDSLGLQKKQVLTAVLQSTSEDSTLDNKNYWTFSHNSQQEFFAAEYLVRQIVSHDKVLSVMLESCKANKLHRYLQVIEFVAGLLALEDELSLERADDIIGLISDQTPCAFEVIKRLAHDISSENEHFHSRLKNLFQDKELRRTLDNFDPDCVQWIIENTAIRVPAQVMLINSARSVVKMKTLLHTLTQKSSKPHIIATIDNMNDIEDLMTFIEDLFELSVGYTLHIQNSVDLHMLIRTWNWHRPLCLRFPQILFPLLWWELKVSLMAADIKLSSIKFSEDVTHAVDFRRGVEQLGLEWVADSSLDASEVVVTSGHVGE